MKPSNFPEICRMSSSQRGVDRAQFNQGPFVSPKKRLSAEEEMKRGRGGVRGNGCVRERHGCPEDERALKATCN